MQMCIFWTVFEDYSVLGTVLRKYITFVCYWVMSFCILHTKGLRAHPLGLLKEPFTQEKIFRL